MDGALLTLLFLLSSFTVIRTETIHFLKTLDGERFTNNLIPSLDRNVSYILAHTKNSKSVINYSLESDFFTVNNQGQVFLISYLDTQTINSITYKNLKMTASTESAFTSLNSTISIVDANDKPPFLLTSRKIFEIFEDNKVPDLISFDNKPVEISFHDPDSSNTDVFVSCENTLAYPDVCSFFSFNKITNKSTSRDWFGTIQVNKRLRYLERSVYQMVVVVQDNMANTKRYVFQIRVLVNLNAAPLLSSDSYTFLVPEKVMSTSRIGKLTLPIEYDDGLSSSVVFQLVSDYQELLNVGISSQAFVDVDFDLVRNYFGVNRENELQSISYIDRDSFVFTSINGLVRMWVKGFFKSNPYNMNYFKISVIFTDINDHKPALGMIADNQPLNTFVPSYIAQPLIFDVNENEIGHMLVNDISVLRKSLISYDLDLGENATFFFFIVEDATDNNLYLSTEQLNYYFSFGSTILNNTECKFVVSKSSINLLNTQPLDYDSLALVPIYDKTTGIGSKALNFKIGVKECSTGAQLSSLLQSVIVNVHDLNDNKPEFSQTTYYASVDVFSTNFAKVLQFDVSDKDSGDYGLSGLNCDLFGHDAHKFLVDSVQQSIFLRKTCTVNCTDYYQPIYYFTLTCRDQKGLGHSSSTLVIINFQTSLSSQCFTVPNTRYYLLATGSSKTDIPKLTIKITNTNSLNKISYEIQDPAQRSLFFVDLYGNFQIIADVLSPAQSPFNNGTFHVPIHISDSTKTCSTTVTVTVQLTNFLTKSRCPQISDKALCHFSINTTNFQPDHIRFCFYAIDRPVYNIPDTSNQPIYFSLLSNSPDYLHINKYDGCVKISSIFKLPDTQATHIQYSVGVFNPEYPDCQHISQRTCLINIINPNLKQLRCTNEFSVSDSSSRFELKINQIDPNSKIQYTIVSEDRTPFTSGTENTQAHTSNFIYKINQNNGLIELADPLQTTYSSIIVKVDVRDLFQLSASTQCFVEFRFQQHTSSNIPQIIGSSIRTEQICEDIPVNSLVTKLTAFDPGFSNQSLCFTVQQTEYFRLQNDTCENILLFTPSMSNGIILLKNSLLNYNKAHPGTPLNLTASLYYCCQSSRLSTQLITFKVLDVNKYAPVPLKQVDELTLNSVDNNQLMFSDPIVVIDNDQSPYNNFKCHIENDKRFTVVYDNYKRSLTINLLDRTTVKNEAFIDLSVQCCDDTNTWTENKCFSVPKCSLTLIRIKVNNMPAPVYCSNNEKSLVISDNIPYLASLFQFQCSNNNSHQVITYKLIHSPNFLTINSSTGMLSLIQSVKYKQGIQRITVECSNGFKSSECQLDLNIVADKDLQPVWIFPNKLYFQNCVVIGESVNLSPGSLITQIEAYSSVLSKVEYYFVNKNRLDKYLYEFKVETMNSFGQILLNENIDRNTNIFREMTLAASITQGDHTVVSYQYICVKIFAINSEEPCFQTTPTGLKWPYKAVINSNQNQCFTDQLIKVYNKNKLDKPVYYYLIPAEAKPIFANFQIDIIKGILCFTNPRHQPPIDLVFSIINSSLSYQDPSLFNQICLDLNIFATHSLLDDSARQKIIYDPQNCSFNYFKLCVVKPDDNNPPVFIKTNKSHKLISLDSLSPVETFCLHQFSYLYPFNKYAKKFTYELISLNNQFDYSIFYINQSLDCLSLKQLNGINKNFLIGLHELCITVSDEYGRKDTLTLHVYITESCQDVVTVHTQLNVNYVRNNIKRILKKFSSSMSELLGKEIKALSDEIYSYPVSGNKTETFLLIAFYDQQMNKFLADSEVVSVLNSNLNLIELRDLEISRVRTSCPLYHKSSGILRKAGVGIWAALLLLMLILVAVFLFCVLCYKFKVLKYQNNRIIMKQSIIPILEDNQSNYQYQTNEMECMNECASGFNSQLRFGGDEPTDLDAIEVLPPTTAKKFNEELLEAIRQRPILGLKSSGNIERANTAFISKIDDNYSLNIDKTSMSFTEHHMPVNRDKF